MSKRTMPQDNQQNTKKVKPTLGLSLLSNDELITISEYLPIGSIIMFSLSSKSLNQIINKHYQKVFPYFIQREGLEGNATLTCDKSEWSLSKALTAIRFLSIEQLIQVEKVKKVIQQAPPPVVDNDEVIVECPKKGSKKHAHVPVTIDYDRSDEEFFGDENRFVLDFNSIPMGFPVRHLKISGHRLYQNDVFDLLSKLTALERLDLDFNVVDKDNGSSGQVLETLKNLQVVGDDTDLVIDILKKSPNLHSVTLKYYQPPNSEFFSQVAESCPNLQQFEMVTNEDLYDCIVPLEITDSELYNFLKKTPKIEVLHLEPCSHITGEIFSKIGEFSNLSTCRIQRRGDGDDDGVVCPSFGGGILPHLTHLEIGESYLPYVDDEEEQNVKIPNDFLEKLFKMAPNLESIGFLHDFLKYLNISDVVNQYMHSLKEAKYLCDCESLDLILEKSQVLEKIYHHEGKMDWKKYPTPIPSVKVLDIDIQGEEELKTLANLFPSVTTLEVYRPKKIIKFLIENDDIWPHLQITNVVSAELLKKRPFLIGDGESRREKYELDDPYKQFIKNWIVLDSVKYH